MYFVGGFLVGLGLSVIHKQWKKEQADKRWAEAADGDREGSEQSG